MNNFAISIKRKNIFGIYYRLIIRTSLIDNAYFFSNNFNLRYIQLITSNTIKTVLIVLIKCRMYYDSKELLPSFYSTNEIICKEVLFEY